MRRYGHYLVRDGAEVVALTVRVSGDEYKLARFDIVGEKWMWLQRENAARLKGLKYIHYESGWDGEGGDFTATKYFCAPADCVYKPEPRRAQTGRKL
ncbi:MAG: hypothetical protein M3416_01345 [Acidobacteriota bacterium]|nr:hypothetical protein [Acidobacteriota bacterium]